MSSAAASFWVKSAGAWSAPAWPIGLGMGSAAVTIVTFLALLGVLLPTAGLDTGCFASHSEGLLLTY